MSKRIFALTAFAFIFLFLMASFSFGEDEPYINQTVDGLLTVNVPLEKSFAPASSTSSLGCAREYCTNNTDGNFRNGSLILYYYDSSVLNDNESDVLSHVLNDLTTTYAYRLNQNDEDLIILENDADMCGMPPFLAGKSDGDGRVAFIGGENLNELESYAGSMSFI